MVTREDYDIYYGGTRLRWVYDGSEGIAVAFDEPKQMVTLSNREAKQELCKYPISELEMADTGKSPMEPPEPLTRAQGPICFECHMKPARKDSRFCSGRCAAAWADEILKGYDDAWCEHCYAWVDDYGHKAECPNNIYREDDMEKALAQAEKLVDIQVKKLHQMPHATECQCDVCTYGADMAKWINNPSEY